MNKEMIISSTRHETRVAILEDDQVVEIFIEREQSRGVVGNIYKGRVSKVLPGMQSAFVDLGLERDAFLYVTDVISPTAESLEDDEEPGGVDPPENAGGGMHEAPETPAQDVVAVDAEERADEPPAALADDSADAELNHANSSDAAASSGPQADVAPAEDSPERQNAASRSERRPRDRQQPDARIEDLLKEGQEIVVQVVKEPLGTKGARITSHLSLPGRFLVYMPTVEHIGVSRKIESREERRRLRGIVQRFREQVAAM
jgi:ribonuclease G